MYLSLFILDVSVVYERWVEKGTDCYINPTYSPDHSSTSSTSWLGLLNRGLLRATAHSLDFLSPTNSTAAGTCLYSFITPTCFCFFFRLFTQVSLIDSSVKGQYTTQRWCKLKASIRNQLASKSLSCKLCLQFINDEVVAASIWSIV